MSTERKPCEHEKKPGFRWHIHDCPNMKEVEGDLSMDCERYECKVCGRRDRLDYEEMK